MLIDHCARPVKSNPGHMLTNVITRSTGVVGVIHVLGSQPERKWAELHLCRDQATKSVIDVNCVDSKHRTRHKWMCCLLTAI
jgi:hypothetical protein